MNQPTDDQAEVRPWEMPGAVRRDCESHRAELLSWLAPVAFWASLFIPCTAGISGLVGLPLAVGVCRMARADLGRMDRGLMDPDGREATLETMYLAVGTLVVCLAMLTFVALMAWAIYF